ncbi:hypothetical protein [Actinomadura monticuli]|uniref:Uncharacterized protein n=1 Tax=Actinomadura monticuli TaxID=3097367 RepID=A0ABV4QJ26_9ACTN
MARQIGPPSLSVLALEQRVAVLERQTAALARAARLLAAALEDVAFDTSNDGTPVARRTRLTDVTALLPDTAGARGADESSLS